MTQTAESRRLLTERYGADPEIPGDLWSAVVEQQLGYRTHRAYLDRELPLGAVDLLVAAAQSAASSSNLQIWSVVAVKDAARKTRLAELSGQQSQIEAAPVFLVFLADLSRNEAVARSEGVEAEAVHYLESLVLATLDVGIAAQNAALAAESLGLGACYIGGIRNNIFEVARELGLPARVYPVVGLAVGYPDPIMQVDVKPRLPQSAVLFDETYAAAPPTKEVAAYNDRFYRFQDKQKLPRQKWSVVVANRLRSSTALRGREHLKAALNALGFSLR